MKSIVICDSTLVDKEDVKVLKSDEGDKAGGINRNLDEDENFSELITSEKNILQEEDDQLEIIEENINISASIKNGNINETKALKQNKDIVRNGLKKDVGNSPGSAISEKSNVQEGIKSDEEVNVLCNETDDIELALRINGAEVPIQRVGNNESNGIKESSLPLNKKKDLFDNAGSECSNGQNAGGSLLAKALKVSGENKENELKETTELSYDEKNFKNETLEKDSELDLRSQDCQIVGESEKTETVEKNRNNMKEISSSSSSIRVKELIPSEKELVKEVEECNKQEDNGSIVVESDENEEVVECDTEKNSPSDDEMKVENVRQEPENSMAVTERETKKNNSVGNLEINSTNSRKRPNEVVNDSAGGKKKKTETVSEDEIVLTDETSLTKTCRNVIDADSTPPPKENKSCQEEGQPESKGKVAVEDRKTESTTANSFFLTNLRGTLKSLTRSDLEELIIQKLCEVITEKSTIGELRRKAQTMEQELEKWKTKAQSLGKQMREMEMVMKKYMSEVQKQIKDGNSQVVVPLRVTRSVGLQVSFFSSGSKYQRGNNTQNAASSPAQSVGASPKPSPSKIQSNGQTPNARNRAAPASQKPGPAIQKQKRTSVPRPDGSNISLIRSPAPASMNVRPVTSEAQRFSSNSQNYQNQQSPQMQPQQMQLQQHQKQQFQNQLSGQQQQQQLQNNSKVIDLTDDDDKQSSATVKPSGPIRVINHASQSQISQNDNRLAYLLPPAPAATSPNGQNRQVLIAAPTLPQSNRNLMSLPPLLYKGGSPAAPASQSAVINQTNNRMILPKHPAPLPPQPIHQLLKPSLKLLPPRPALKISKVQTGIVLSWNLSLSSEHAPISSYQLYAYQESNSPPDTSLWKKVGDVKALPLPMACTLTQFMSGHKYHFAVRAVDLHSRIGPFSFPGTIVLVK